ncbi:hypothetical protein BH20ACT8_BH20ACT8_02500 [soil metagenome]
MRSTIQLAALSLSGLLAGNELATLIGAHPAVRTLPLRTQIEAEQALTDRLGKVMPVYTSATLVAVGAAAADRAGTPAFRLTVTAAAATAAMLAITGLGNIPLNQRTTRYPVDGDAQGWAGIRRPWERLHLARVLLDLAAFGCLATAALNVGREQPAS